MKREQGIGGTGPQPRDDGRSRRRGLSLAGLVAALAGLTGVTVPGASLAAASDALAPAREALARTKVA